MSDLVSLFFMAHATLAALGALSYGLWLMWGFAGRLHSVFIDFCYLNGGDHCTC
jgi:hypothetical protein